MVCHSQSHREQTQAQTHKQYQHQETLITQNTFLEDQETVSWNQYPPDENPFETDDFSSHFFPTVNPLERPPTSETVKHQSGPDPPQVMPPPKFRQTDSSSGVKEQYSVVTVGPSHCGSHQSQNDLDVSMSHDQSKTIDEKLYPNASTSSGGSSGGSFGKNIKEMACGRSITTERKRKHITDTDGTVSQSDVCLPLN